MVVALLNLPTLQNCDLAERLQEHVLECERLGDFFFKCQAGLEFEDSSASAFNPSAKIIGVSHHHAASGIFT